MKSPLLNTIPVLIAVAFGLGASGVSMAQTEPEEELEMIELGDRYDNDDVATEDEIFDGLIFDQDSQQYRLIEDPEEEDLEEPPSQREQDIEEIGRLFSLYKESVTSANFLEADTLAKRIVELSIKVFGINSAESAKALTNLAIAQHGNREYEAAERNFRAAIDIIESISDRLNSALINPLRGLGATQLAIGRPDMARATFKRAVHVSHVNDGPHNLDQLVVLESMAEIYLAVGDHQEALDIQERMYSIQARNLDPFSLDLLPALRSQAQWQHRLQMYDRERMTWRKIIDVLERHFGKNDLRLIPALTNLGKSYLFITPAEYDMQPEISVASGETYLRRATRIADTNPDSDWQIREQSMLAIGDYYLLSGRANRAARTYKDLWVMLSEDEARLGNRHDHLERLNVLQDIYPPKYYRSEEVDQTFPDPEDFETGTVSYGFTVNAAGKAIDVVHIETQPPEFEDMSARVRRNLRQLVYRPRLEDGTMVPTPELTFTHEFYYRPEDVPTKSSEESEESEESEDNEEDATSR
jgi:tetratricopeptide (TPR) repeat protein